jgi:hypothetical protein
MPDRLMVHRSSAGGAGGPDIPGPGFAPPAHARSGQGVGPTAYPHRMAERPGWHGIPPSADRYIPPLQLGPPEADITEPLRSPALWVELDYPDGSTRTMKGFAMAWTGSVVLAQWIEYSRAREAWVDAARCRRRALTPRTTHAA